jgi:hypothetical protein
MASQAPGAGTNDNRGSSLETPVLLRVANLVRRVVLCQISDERRIVSRRIR